MTDQTPPNTESDKSIDRILENYRQVNFSPKPFEPSLDKWEEKYKVQHIIELETAKSLLYSLLMDVIGEDEQPHDIRLMDTNTAIFLNNKIAFCNRLRAEQRQKLNQLFNKEK